MKWLYSALHHEPCCHQEGAWGMEHGVLTKMNFLTLCAMPYAPCDSFLGKLFLALVFKCLKFCPFAKYKHDRQGGEIWQQQSA